MGTLLTGRRLLPLCLIVLVQGRGPAPAQEPFPPGVEGEIFYCPRIDLNPAKDGGPLQISLDGVLDEAAWKRSQFQHWSIRAGENPTPDFDPPELDTDLEWAAVADKDFLYVAWRVIDETRVTGESAFCDVWMDDSVEVYIDALNDGPSCPDAAGNCYLADDAQLTIGADQIGKTDPDLLEFGGLGGKASCDFTGPAPELCKGIAAELDSPDGYPGWQGEIAIALDTMGNGADGTPEWHLVPSHGTVIGFSIQVNDDDNGGARDHKLLWSKIETVEQAWRNPGVFGKLVFVAPDKGLTVVSRDIQDGLHNGDTGTVFFKVSPKFGAGAVSIEEVLPRGLTASSPTDGGVINGNTITWDLGKVAVDRTVSYTLTIEADAADASLSGSATIDGDKLVIGGDTSYSGSPITTDGFIKLWNHLGPLSSGLTGGLTCSSPDLAADWIVNEDGSIDEGTIAPFPGMFTKPKYGGTGVLADGSGARSTGVVIPGGGVVTDRFPLWHAGLSSTDTINHASPQVNGFNADDQVTFSCIYVTNLGQTDIDTRIGLGSDDSIEVYLDDTPVFTGGACRGFGNPGEEQDVAPVVLPVGESRILVKVADGTLDSGFRLRIQDPAGGGLLPPAIALSLESKLHPPPVKVARVLPEKYRLNDQVIVSLNAITPAPADVTINEALPAGTQAADISDGGVAGGGAVVWHLAAVTTRTVSYRLVHADCSGDLVFQGSTCAVGPVESLVSGASKLIREVPDEDLGQWASQDIGSTGGSAQPIDDAAVLESGAGTGLQIGQNQDQFHFVSRSATGDFELTARIDCLDGPPDTAEAGLMVRDTTDTFSSHAFFYLTNIEPTGGGVGTLKGLFRHQTSTTRFNSTIVISDRNVASLPITLKMKRVGSLLTLQRWDGTQFKDVGTKEIGSDKTTKVDLGDTTIIGLAASGGSAETARATFGGLSGFSSGGQPTFRRGDVDGTGVVELTDVINLIGFLFLGNPQSLDCLDAADVDDTGVVELTDAIVEIGWLFLGDPKSLPAPGPLTCGPDPTQSLGCTTACKP